MSDWENLTLKIVTSTKESEFQFLKTAKCRKADKENIRTDGKYYSNDSNRLQFPPSSQHCPIAALSTVPSALEHNLNVMV